MLEHQIPGLFRVFKKAQKLLSRHDIGFWVILHTGERRGVPPIQDDVIVAENVTVTENPDPNLNLWVQVLDSADVLFRLC